MFERFTERARQVVVFAQEEACVLKHDYIGTEHLLLGLLREEEGLAARVLESLGITVERVRAQVVRIVGSGEEVTSGQFPFTPRAKKVLELALREALSLGQSYIATEHILLGVVRENQGVAARVLLDFGADAEKIRNGVIRMLALPSWRPPTETGAVSGLEFSINVGLAPQLRRVLMVAAARALDNGRTETQLNDLLLALTRDQQTAGQLIELGVDEAVVRQASQRSDPPDEPPPGPATS